VRAVRVVGGTAVRRARAERQPRFIEAVTYRYRGHSMSDPGAYRTKEEIQDWERRDPIPRMHTYLLDEGILTQEDLDRIDAETTEVIDDAVRFADESPEPSQDELYADVYA